MNRTENRIDLAVIEACKAGDTDAFRAIFDACQRGVYSTALHFLNGNHAAAEDVVQDVFVRVFTRIGQFRSEADLRTWIYRMTANVCVDNLRKARREGAALRELYLETNSDAWSTSDANSDLRAALNELPPKIRITVLMRHFMELSYEEMAIALGCSPGTVASRINRGHKLLKKRLASIYRPKECEG